MYLRSTRAKKPGLGEAEWLALGLATFESARSIASSGNLSMETSTVNYIHEKTPPTRRFTKRTIDFRITAFHPRFGIGTQEFWFRLSFEFNGNDLRNAHLVLLEGKSSRMITSSFSVKFIGLAHSVPADPVAQVLFQISGLWNPVGRGRTSFWGELRLVADGKATLSISSENGWVRHGSLVNLRDASAP